MFSGCDETPRRALLVALALACLACGVVAQSASAAAGGVKLRSASAQLVESGGRTPQRHAGGATTSNEEAIPLLSPHPGQLRRAKAEAAKRVSGGAAPSLRPLSPLPRATLFGGLNRAGMSAAESGGEVTPPDATGAIGPSNYVEFVNGTGITAYDRSLNPVSGPVALEEFINFPSDSVFDPQIQWDVSWGRWIYAMDDIENPGTSEEENYLAFGWSKTADPSNLSTEFPGEGAGAGWCEYFIATGEEFDDYPKLGHSDSGLTIGTNVFTTGFLGSRLWSIAKPADPSSCPEFESVGESPNLTVASSALPLTEEEGNEAFTPVPANTADSSPNSYVVAAGYPEGGPANQIMAWHISGAGAGASLFEDGNMEVGAFEFPANVPQPGTSEVIDSSDTRLTNAVGVTDPAVGEEAVWTQHTIDGPGGRSVVRWYELLPAKSGGPEVRQEGTISDASQFVFNGAISPTKQGNAAAIDFNRGSATLNPEIHAQSRDSGTTLGQMEGDIGLGTSGGADEDFSCDITEGEPCRWGDYAGASPDPSLAGVVWGSSQGLAAPSGDFARWTTRNFALIADPAVPVTPPAAPTISGTDPASPANANNPKVKGSAEAGSTVRIYKSSDCSGPVAAQGSASGFESPGIAVTVANDAVTRLTATATNSADNTSACSAPFTYTEDSTPPAAPTISGTDPASPADENNPKVKGSAEAGSTVRVFKSGDCSGPVAAQGSAAAFASPGLAVSVAADTTTQLTATATDAVGNTSPCSAASSYTEQTPPPSTPAVSTLPPPAKGKAVAAAVALVKGGKALLRLRCRGAGVCQGSLKLVVRVKVGKHGRKRTHNLVIGRAGFAIAAGRSKTVAVRLKAKGKALLRKAGSRGLRVKLRGSGVGNRTVRLRIPRRHHRKA